MKTTSSAVLFIRYVAIILCFSIGFASIVATGGTSGGDAETATGNDSALPDPVTKEVTPEEGGLLVLSNGTELEIPPDAVDENINVTISAFHNDEEGLFLGGLILEPGGLVLKKPATMRVPLPKDWPSNEFPVIYEAKNSNPLESLPRGDMAEVINVGGTLIAEAQIYHFSCDVVSYTCHAGTIKRVLQNFESRGCDRQNVIDKIKERYEGRVPFDERHCKSAGAYPVQAMLDTYFTDMGGWDPDVPVPANILAGIIEAARQGKQVVFAFSGKPWEPRGGENLFYPYFAHTAPLLLEGDNVIFRNTIKTLWQDLRDHFGGEVTADWPADQVNEFRKLRESVALEIDFCGEEGCLADASKNDIHRDVLSPISMRQTVPYPSVRIYVEKAEPGENPCEDEEIDFGGFEISYYRNSDGSTGSGSAGAEISLSGSTAYPTIDWSLSDVINITLTSGTGEMLYGVVRIEDEEDNLVPLSPPVVYGTYNLENTTPIPLYSNPSPALVPGIDYGITIVSTSASWATIIFRIK